MYEKETSYFEKTIIWIENHITGLLVIIGLFGIVVLFYYLDWWDVIGLMILNLGLGVKLNGAKTFAVAVAKSGGKKALAMTMSGVLLKRHLIDVFSKFFTEHSVSRYKNNIKYIIRIKITLMKESSPFQKMKAFGSTLLSIPVIYFLWAKVLGTAIQKFIYVLVYPLFTGLFSIIAQSFNVIYSFIGFIIQLTLLNYLMNWMNARPFGRVIINWVSDIFIILGNIMNFSNSIFKIFGLDPKHKMIVWSIKFNRWLEGIILKDFNLRDKLIQRRKIHLTSREILISKRENRKVIEKDSLYIKTKEFFDEKILKKRDWRKTREIRRKRFE